MLTLTPTLPKQTPSLPPHPHSAGSLCPAILAAIVSLEKDSRVLQSPHHYLTLSFASLFGAGVIFRLMAMTLVLVPPTQKKRAWKAIIWLSWLIPLILCEVALRSVSLAVDGEAPKTEASPLTHHRPTHLC